MAGLHQCCHCGYRFETEGALEGHLEGGCPEAEGVLL